METEKILVEHAENRKKRLSAYAEKLSVKMDYDKLYIGDEPQLIVDLKTQENYIEFSGGRIKYYREVSLSKDLLEGKRKHVLDTALIYYYEQACKVLEGKRIADAYQRMTADKK